MTAQPAARSDAKRSIDYMLDAALTYGGVSSFAHLLDQVARLSPYKPFNALLVLLQRPAATYVRPAHHWEERHGRLIKPGEQPLVMLQPNGPVMFLFDVSQTEPLPNAPQLPFHLQNPFRMQDARNAGSAWQWLVTNAKADGVRVSDTSRGFPSAGCIWPENKGLEQVVEVSRRPPTTAPIPVRYETLVNTAHSDTERLCTLAHELGHLYCGHVGTHDPELWPDRRSVPYPATEFEAEAVARLVFRRLAPEAELPPYLDQFVSKGEPPPQIDVERVLTAAGRVLEMAQDWAPRRPKRRGSRRAADQPRAGAGS